ncbi:hypothetical protein MIND_00325800 [Mycena indigotica]|uniref:Myosin-binding domain-containing protein n=1 Tax=Mycena indigotica TaxID=2126181 RepID=A0A8H6WEJ9_9AGAR|nr:uncharacterized protein MIND_00325800 [Mycena indigotica]KAF7309549.1 hypothetical protein MIND_00325800 [Mycena indigotica]
MAQPLFDDHPLEQYLRAAGEPPELMPGSLPELTHDFDAEYCEFDEEEEWRPVMLVQFVTMLQALFPQPQESLVFAERFKYDVISSSLLETSFPTGNSRRRSGSPAPPGKLKLDNPPHPEPIDYSLMSLIFFFAAVFFATGTYLLAFLFIVGGTLHLYTHSDNAKPDMAATMAALSELITANDLWDSVVQNTLTLLEKEEESPPSPVSSVRLAIHSSLHTTQTQCDNVRHLLSALTAPVELAQLSEMYAPPSPRHSPPPPETATHSESKRTTWNGSYSSLYGSPALKTRDKRRSDLSLLFTSQSTHKSYSAPNTPPATSTLVNVVEEGAEQHQPFGIAALELHRRRRLSGMDVFKLTPPRTPLTGSSTISHASRFTTMQTMRNPLGLSALYHALDGALASKRYACSHLLALRFGDEDDEGYWEDVRSVIALLTSTFVDTASRLTEALEEAQLQEAALCHPESESSQDIAPALRQATSSMFSSFAPVPSQLTRFAAHVDAISAALDDAREQLADCVAAIRDEDNVQQPLHRKRSRTFSLSKLSAEATSSGQAEPRALQAYERLRRELGLALRECERGRDRLMDIVAPRPPPLDPTESEEEGMPGLALDASDEADESDKPESGDDDPPVVHTVVIEPDAPEPPAETFTIPLERPGVEQVFESLAEVGTYTRERSKLTREERIKLAKAHREQAQAEDSPTEKWGPGGDVVQELKDVIWQVGERRRKLVS